MHGHEDSSETLPESQNKRAGQESSVMRSSAPQKPEEAIEEPCRCLSCSRTVTGKISQARPATPPKEQQLAWQVDLGQKQKQPTRPATSRRPATARKPVYQWDDNSITVSLDSEPDAAAASSTMTHGKGKDEKCLEGGKDAAEHSDTETGRESSGILSDCSLSDLGSDGSSDKDDVEPHSVPTMTAKVRSYITAIFDHNYGVLCQYNGPAFQSRVLIAPATCSEAHSRIAI